MRQLTFHSTNQTFNPNTHNEQNSFTNNNTSNNRIQDSGAQNNTTTQNNNNDRYLFPDTTSSLPHPYQSHLNNNSNPLANNTLLSTVRASDTADSHHNHHYMTYTENSHKRSNHYSNQLDDQQTAMREQERVFGRRRPISAPHTRYVEGCVR